MNICLFTDISGLGGGELWALRATRELVRQGHRVSIVCPYRGHFFQRCLEQGLDVFGYQNLGLEASQESVRHFLARRRVDVIYCTVIGAFLEARFLEQAAERVGGAIVVLKTGLPPMARLTPESYGAGAGARVRRLHVVSEATRQSFVEWYPAFDSFTEVRLEGIEADTFRPKPERRAADRAQWGIAPEDILIAAAARLTPLKGLDNLLLALGEIARESPHVRLVIAGDGEDRGRLAKLAHHLGIAEKVEFAGHLERVAPLLNAADLFCHPSLADGLPNSVVEALAAGLPVVGSSVGAIPELLGNGAGMVTPVHDIKALIAALRKLIASPEIRAEMGAEAWRRSERYSLSHHTRLLAHRLEEELQAYRSNPDVAVAPPPAPAKETATPVLFLMTCLRTGGEETEIGILSQYLNRGEFRPRVLSCYAVDEPAPVMAKLEALRIPVDTTCHGFRSADEKIDYIAQVIRTEQIRVVVACQDTAIATKVFERLDSPDCRLIEHGGIASEPLRASKQYTARYIGVSRAIAASAATVMPNPAAVSFLPSMVDTAEYEAQDRDWLRRGYGFEGSCMVAFVGRLDAKKGVHILVDSAAELLPGYPNLRFLVVGGADAFQQEYARDVMLYAKQRIGAIDHQFVFAGSRTDIARLLTAVDIVVLPSKGEGMSHVINEAGAAGRAVIATDDGAAREQLEDGECGIVIPKQDRPALTEALKRLIDDEGLRDRLGSRLKQRVQQHYSAHTIVPKWEELLRETAKGTTPVPIAPALRIVAREPMPAFPLEIQIETNTACNATCVMCPYPEVSKELPQGRMDLELYQKILEECAAEKGVRRLEPFLNNEPFTDTRIVDLIAMAKKTVPHALVTVTSNGSLLPPKVTDRLIRSGLDAIWFSFNGATKATYEEIMGLSWDKVKANIDYLLDVKPQSLRVFTNMIETTLMRGEIVDNIRYWQSRGVQSGSSPLVNRAGNVKNFTELNYKPVGDGQVRLCDLLFHKMYIGYNGDVLLCCMDWRRKVVLGNVRKQSLREVWNGEPYRRYRQLQIESRANELDLCKDCTYIAN
ncbi:MAG: glycosyltransferase [Bryobacterales bacterium]|nr:glycosyltransferase [Bryobacterales bacterium]